MFKQMFVHTSLLTRMLSIIILRVIPSIAKAVSCFPNILLTGQKINKAVIITVKFAIYFILCLASKCVRFTNIHAYFTPFLTTISLILLL